jgi:hypothetical protein
MTKIIHFNVDASAKRISAPLYGGLNYDWSRDLTPMNAPERSRMHSASPAEPIRGTFNKGVPESARGWT